jgi:hypothetical protein
LCEVVMEGVVGRDVLAIFGLHLWRRYLRVWSFSHI